ncbi:DUF3035 domain-containing protein [Falsirhodobacter deserti]|uniref:DUF3035 domain-containing protein n=1 Tax=Falsirhodobacter deserti TaxID=1365611 RepID=UPI000FE2B78C|nr:DUF3035 domain-containing protein [Falsirhodobacter deserti]
MRAALALAGGAFLMLSACGGDDPNLIRLRSAGNGPDEFSVVPQKPLQMPPSLNALPPPTPGGVNRTEPNPQAEAITALGGNPNAGAAGDGALLAATGRYGTEAGVRGQLAAEDEAFRAGNRGRLLDRVLNNTTYYQAYGDELLDPQSETVRWRQQGRRTPAAPLTGQ